MSGKSQSKALTLVFGVTGMPSVNATQLYQDLQNIVSSFQKNNGTIHFAANVTKIKKSLASLKGGSPIIVEIDEKQKADLQKIKSIVSEITNPANPQTNWANKLEDGVTAAMKPTIQLSKEVTLATKKAQMLAQTFKDAPPIMQQTVVPDMTKTNDGLIKMREYYEQAAKEADELYKLQAKASAAMYATKGKDSQFSKNAVIGLNQTKELDDYYALLEKVQLAKSALTTKQDGTLDFDKIDSTQLRQFLELTDRLPTSLKAARTASANFSKQSNANNAWDKLAARAQAYYLQIEKIVARNPQLAAEMQNLVGRIRNQDFSSVAEGQNEFLKLQQRIRDAGLETETLGQKIKRAFSEKFIYIASMAGVNLLRDGLRQIYQNVVDIDSALTELKKTTDETNSTYNKFLDDAGVRAQKIVATIPDIVSSTADFTRLGYSLNEAIQLSDSAIVFKNVGDGITSISEATEMLISAMKAFDIAAEDSSSVIDKYNEVGNHFAISSQGIGQVLQRSAAALAEAGNTIDNSIGLAVGMNSVLQDPEKVGNVLKTSSMFLRAAKTDLEDADESTEGLASSVSELRALILKLTNDKVDIQIDENSFKSTFQIYKELAGVWDTIQDIDQAALLEKLGGKRNANAIAALLANFDEAEAAAATAAESTGSAMEENSKFADSIQGHLNAATASFQTLSTAVLDSGLVKFGIDVLKTITDAATGLQKVHALLPLIAAGYLAIANIKSAGGTKTTVLFDTPARVLVATRNEYAA